MDWCIQCSSVWTWSLRTFAQVLREIGVVEGAGAADDDALALAPEGGGLAGEGLCQGAEIRLCRDGASEDGGDCREAEIRSLGGDHVPVPPGAVRVVPDAEDEQ